MNCLFLLAIGIGIVAGLRSLLAPAIIAWAAHFGSLNLHGSPFAFMGSTAAVAIFSIFAIGELVADKLPKTPKRIAFAPLLARFLLGGLSGASIFVSAAGKSLFTGALVGGTGGVIGAFVGYEIRGYREQSANQGTSSWLFAKTRSRSPGRISPFFGTDSVAGSCLLA